MTFSAYGLSFLPAKCTLFTALKQFNIVKVHNFRSLLFEIVEIFQLQAVSALVLIYIIQYL